MGLVILISGAIVSDPVELALGDIALPSGVVATLVVYVGVSCSGFHVVGGIYTDRYHCG